MDRREFWATKSRLPEFHTITFTHPDFLPAVDAEEGDDNVFRLVANEFEPVVLGGQRYRPAPMTIKPPDQTGDASARLSMAFPRAVVGREFKRQLRLVRAAGSREPIAVVYAVFLGGNNDTPAVTWELFVGEENGVSFTADSVQVSATRDNPMRRSVGVIYDPAVWTGLELI